ncbi:MAG TPA: 4Fe-4S dicluster domain-containing protein [Dissulfurispiraceae bacterium]|nr:4Fe-4S dicluster domain-containing protein [Dissulfurispiraceae bacterium]
MKEATINKKVTGRIEIDRERCKGCGYCIGACPKEAIAIDERFNSSGYFPAVFASPDKCNGCAMCAHVCPDIAIEVWRDE